MKRDQLLCFLPSQKTCLFSSPFILFFSWIIKQHLELRRLSGSSLRGLGVCYIVCAVWQRTVCIFFKVHTCDVLYGQMTGKSSGWSMGELLLYCGAHVLAHVFMSVLYVCLLFRCGIMVVWVRGWNEKPLSRVSVQLLSQLMSIVFSFRLYSPADIPQTHRGLYLYQGLRWHNTPGPHSTVFEKYIRFMILTYLWGCDPEHLCMCMLWLCCDTSLTIVPAQGRSLPVLCHLSLKTAACH